MHTSFRAVRKGELAYYFCDILPVRHAFTTKLGGVSSGDCESLNLGFGRGDVPHNVHQNYRILCSAMQVPYDRMTLTHQIHADQVSVVTENCVGMGLTKPMAWDSDAIVTTLPETPLAGFYADCVVTLLYDPVSQSCGVCHTGWRGIGNALLLKTVEVMVNELGADRNSVLAVMGPSIHACCFETDEDVPTALEAELGDWVNSYMHKRGAKWFLDLQSIGQKTLTMAGLPEEHVIDSGICTKCCHEEFWSHRATQGKRGVQAGVICL